MFEKELEKNKQELETIKNSLVAAQVTFANKMINGMGDDIKESLKNPEKPKLHNILKFKIKNFFKKLIKIC